jgi:hypothetical protein
LAKNNNINNLVQTRAIVNAKKELRTVVTSKTNSMRLINFDGIPKSKMLCSMTELQMAMDCTFHEIAPPPHISCSYPMFGQQQQHGANQSNCECHEGIDNHSSLKGRQHAGDQL